ncbi:permease for cytosine/purines, uracil, thiamine, allantoin-domain-containing protein [Mycena latifolia]|nr:permease for cytosine/purines, uracil, thiamine, allantoin-domain-containing protein [Mycena latifolia]
MPSQLLERVNSAVKLQGDEDKHERTDAWSNRDLIPLPPARRTWTFFHFFGYWTLGSLNVATWQMPNTFLTVGLSVERSMAVIIISRAIVGLFSFIVASCGLRWHVGFTVQNRYSWGMRGSYIPLIQRVMLNFIWTATQCWTGGKLVSVIITAMFPSFQNITSTFAGGVAKTTDMIGFLLFWLFSIPFLMVPPEKFRLPFQIISVYCSLSMLCMLIWSLSVAKGVGPVFHKGEVQSSSWSTAWLMMRCINSTIGGKAAGMTNGSDYSRYGRRPRDFVLGTISCLFCVGTLVSFIGLVVTAACQKIYGEIYWNPPDLLMRMMESGEGSSKARAGVFFLALGFALTSGFENICGNAVAGGIDLSGMFPRYINIRRGAVITFMAAWICQPWQLVNQATTFLTVISSFSVFLAPMMGIMSCDFFILRKQRIKLTDLYELHGSYYFWHGINWRAIPAWLAGWAPTIGGLWATAGLHSDAPRPLFQLYYLSFFLGFFISAIVFYVLNLVFPVTGLGEIDDTDVFGTFTPEEARRRGMAPVETGLSSETDSIQKEKI